MSNAIKVIFPYQKNGVWMFDDAAVGLKEEPFVSGAPEAIDRLVADIPGANTGFALYFAESPFPGFQMKGDWLREQYGGNWYRVAGTDHELWLCAAMFKYFTTSPMEIYARAEALKQGEGPRKQG